MSGREEGNGECVRVCVCVDSGRGEKEGKGGAEAGKQGVRGRRE